jgi:hypothetical protein
MSELTRRRFLERTGFLAAAGLLAQLPGRFAAEALSAKSDLVHDTLSGLVAFVVPGPDPYSRQQGEVSKTPGGIAAGATKALVETLDLFLVTKPPFSATVTSILNSTAEQLDPGVVPGKFQSSFANLAFSQKAEVFRRLEAITAPEAGALRFLAGNLPGLVAFLTYSEARTGWKLAHYSGAADGRPELKGYFQGRTSIGA